MLATIMVPIICACFLGAIRLKEIEMERNWKACEEIDWNEYYANI